MFAVKLSAVLTSGTCLCTCMDIFMYIYSFAVVSPCVCAAVCF